MNAEAPEHNSGASFFQKAVSKLDTVIPLCQSLPWRVS